MYVNRILATTVPKHIHSYIPSISFTLFLKITKGFFPVSFSFTILRGTVQRDGSSEKWSHLIDLYWMERCGDIFANFVCPCKVFMLPCFLVANLETKTLFAQFPKARIIYREFSNWKMKVNEKKVHSAFDKLIPNFFIALFQSLYDVRQKAQLELCALLAIWCLMANYCFNYN